MEESRSRPGIQGALGVAWNYFNGKSLVVSFVDFKRWAISGVQCGGKWVSPDVRADKALLKRIATVRHEVQYSTIPYNSLGTR
jgi:hypothetical protein